MGISNTFSGISAFIDAIIASISDKLTSSKGVSKLPSIFFTGLSSTNLSFVDIFDIALLILTISAPSERFSVLSPGNSAKISDVLIEVPPWEDSFLFSEDG